MAYQDDFRNKVLAALKAKNLAVDISQEETQQAIVEEVQNVAASESRPMSAEEMRSVLQDVATQLAADNNQTFRAQSTDFTALYNFPEGGGPGGSYSGGGIALSTANKDIMIIPAAGALGAAGLATSVNSLSQIDFKHIANPNAYNQFDPNEVKSSIYNWAERKSGQLFDTPVLGIGGAWGGVSYAPTSGWGVQTGSIGGSQGSGVGGSINFANGFGQIIYIKPASSTFYAALYNDVGINVDAAIGAFSLTGYNAATPNTIPTAGFAVTFGGTGGSGDLIIQGALLGTQVNTARFGSSLSILNSTATDTLVLGLSSATIVGTATSVNFPGGTGATTNTYVLATNAPTFALGDIFYSAGVGHTTLARLAVSGNNQYLTTVGGVPQWTNTISATTVAVNAATGSTVLYPLLNNAAGSGSAVSTDIDFSVDPAANILRYATGSFYVGTAVSAPTYTGAGSLVTYTSPATVIIKPGTNAVNAILMQASAGSTVVNVDTNNGRVSIGSGVTAPVYTLDVLGDTNLSTGSVYRIAGAQILSSNTLGSSVTASSLTSVGTLASGIWQASTIAADRGGTGQNTYSVGDLLYGNTGNTLSKLAATDAGQFLVSNGVGAAPIYVAGSGLSVGKIVLSANTVNAENYIPFVSGVGGVGLSISNQTSQLTYNPSFQQLKVPFITGTAFTATNLTGTLLTASQPNITSVGTLTGGTWQATAVGTTYGGTGSNLGSAIGNSNKVVITGTIANGYAASLIDGANTGYLLAANGNGAAPSFVNTTNAAFSFASGTLTINNATITTGTIATTPTGGTDIANKSYVDSISGGLDPHASVRLTTISAIGGSYRQAGSAGTTWGQGDYIIATTPAELIGVAVGLDTPTSGIALTNGQRVLIKDGVLGSYATGSGNYALFSSITTYGGFAASYVANGIYTVASYGGAATSGWLLIRATDTDNGSGVQELTGGTFTFVEEGTQFADNAFVCTNDTTSFGAIGFGATQITWSAFSGGASLTMGQGLSKSGNTVATNFNFTNDSNLVSGIQYKGFSLGGVRSGGVGFSSLATFTVSSTNAPSSNTLTALGTGFTLAGGETSRTLTVNGTGNVTLDGGNNTLTLSGSSITLTGGGFTLTLNSNSTASFNGQTLALTASMGNVTFAGSANPTATTQTIVTSGQTQYQLSSQTNTWTAGDMYYSAGTAFTALARLAFGSGTGNSVLIRGASQPTWGTIALGNSDFVSGILTTTNGGTGANLDTSIGRVVYTDGTKLAVTSVGTSGQTLLSTGSGAPAFGTLTLAGGGTSNTASGVNVAWQLAAYNSVGSGISGIAQATANNSVLLQASANSTPVWSNGPLAIAYGGSNATSSSFTANGVVIYDSGNTKLASATGLTMIGGVGLSVTGTVAASGGFFVGSNSVLSSVTPAGGSAIYGAVGIAVSNTNPAGSLIISGSGQTIYINGPGTGITGTGVATQIPYYSASSTLTGDVGLVYSRTAATGTGLSVNINATTGTIFSINTPAAMTAGNLIDFDINGVQRFGVDWKGMATHTASASGNTALVIAGGRTILAPPNANYASLNFGITNANPGSGTSFQGDLWYNGTNLYFQTGATTKFDLLVGSVSGSGTINKVVKWNTTTSLTDSNITDAGVGMTITSTSTIAPAAGGGSTSVLTLQTISVDNQLTDRYFLRGVTSAGTRLFSIDTAGNLRATTKSFDIPHPTKEGLRLVYGVLEGPEHGVYHRGTVEGKGTIQVNLPDYWHKLVGEQYTIQLTPWGNYNVGIGSKTENYFTIQLVGDFISRKYKNIKVDYIVHGSRLDAPLDTEQ